MKYIEFKNSYRDVPIINISTIEGLGKNGKSFRDNVNKWSKKGYVYRLKNGLYTLNDDDRRVPLTLFFIANNIYTPSYVSLEYALYYHGLIPERVYEVTSVSPLKTNTFKNYYAVFSYGTVKQELFFGFDIKKDFDGVPAMVASPEKALLDYIYLRFCRRKGEKNIDVFLRSNRVQELETLDKKKYRNYLEKFPARYREFLAAPLKMDKR